MTKLRPPMTAYSALLRICEDIGWDTAADVLRVKERTVRSWSEPDVAAEISFRDATRLDAAWMQAGGEGDPPFLRTFKMRLEMDGRENEDGCLIDAAMLMAKEGGEAIEAILAASKDFRNPQKRRRATKELQEAMEAMFAAGRRLTSQDGGKREN